MVSQFQHPTPVWRERADFIIAAQLPEDGRSEQLWAHRVGEFAFEVCCIPFFLYDVALGDVIETDEGYLVRRVLRRSGRYVFRIWFKESPDGVRDETTDRLASIGCLTEWHSANLLAVDAAHEAMAQEAADMLEERAQAGLLAYENGLLFAPDSDEDRETRDTRTHPLVHPFTDR